MIKPRMTKAHYKLIASAIYNCEYKSFDYIVQDIANALVGTNKNFDPEYQLFHPKCK